MSDSSLIVFAEKVQQMQQAKRNYLSKCKKGLISQKADALKELHRIESEVEELVYGILYSSKSRQLFQTDIRR